MKNDTNANEIESRHSLANGLLEKSNRYGNGVAGEAC